MDDGPDKWVGGGGLKVGVWKLLSALSCVCRVCNFVTRRLVTNPRWPIIGKCKVIGYHPDAIIVSSLL